MFNRMAFAAFLVVFFPGPAAMSEEATRVPQNSEPNGAANSPLMNTDEYEMKVGRYYSDKKDYTGAINRFKTVVTRFPSSPFIDEALFRIAASTGHWASFKKRRQQRPSLIASSRTATGAPMRGIC